jgi:Lrp/AsnC family transcriptional regulator, regulator for asnA, asnC and gidA
MAELGASLKLDELDLKILRAFRFGGRVSNSEIARQVEVSEGTVRRRLANLEQVGVLKFVAITDPQTLGFGVNVIIGIKADGDKIQSVAEQLAAFPEVPYTAISMGSLDVWVTALLPSIDAWLDLRRRIAQIDGIRSTESHRVARVLKQNFDWVLPDESLIGADGSESVVARGGP